MASANCANKIYATVLGHKRTTTVMKFYGTTTCSQPMDQQRSYHPRMIQTGSLTIIAEERGLWKQGGSLNGNLRALGSRTNDNDDVNYDDIRKIYKCPPIMS